MKNLFHVLFVCLGSASALTAQTTAFTYQGRLNHGGSAAHGLYEMSFALYDAPTNGSIVGAVATVAPVPVTNGLFTAPLDFGAAAFMGADRWLEISVTVFGSDQPVVTLQPRQPLTPTPYALHAANAAGLMSFANAPLDIKVNGERAFRLEPTSLFVGEITGAPNVIGGSSANFASYGVTGATIGGGGAVAFYGDSGRNAIDSSFGTISGGRSNTISDQASGATIAGGSGNTIKSEGGGAVIGGGSGNTIEEDAGHATIAGGWNNHIWNDGDTIGGGYRNTAGSGYATVAGGQFNSAFGWAASIGGGNGNYTEGEGSSIGGGHYNTNGSAHNVIAGGLFNRIETSSPFSTISGGASNIMAEKVERSTIGGGANNTIGFFANATTIAGGMNNVIDGTTGGSTISGGWFNHINEEASLVTIAGGGNNSIGDNAGNSTISGGSENGIGASASHATISGGFRNHAGSEGATVAGGMRNSTAGTAATVGGGESNSSADDHATVSGGFANISTDLFATVGGGGLNRATGFGSVVAGGGGVHFEDGFEDRGNTASGRWSGVLGGADNVASGLFSVVGGGEANRASGNYGTIPGGLDCQASGELSFAAGWGAHALHDGSFVWSGFGPPLGGPHFESTTNNQFSARAAGGVRFFTDLAATTGAELAPGSGTWSSLSDRNAKENFTAANAREILDKVAALPLASWNYKAQDKSVRHLGPMAQDFHAAFGLGESDRTISTVDADGVALAAIQGLNQKVEQKEARIQTLERELAALKELVARLAGTRN